MCQYLHSGDLWKCKECHQWRWLPPIEEVRYLTLDGGSGWLNAIIIPSPLSPSPQKTDGCHGLQKRGWLQRRQSSHPQGSHWPILQRAPQILSNFPKSREAMKRDLFGRSFSEQEVFTRACYPEVTECKLWSWEDMPKIQFQGWNCNVLGPFTWTIFTCLWMLLEIA